MRRKAWRDMEKTPSEGHDFFGRACEGVPGRTCHQPGGAGGFFGINLVNSDVIYYYVINDWLTTAEGDSPATLGCGFRGVRRESEGMSRG